MFSPLWYYPAPGARHVTFAVRACGEAHVGLSVAGGDERPSLFAWNVELGTSRNAMSVIRRRNSSRVAIAATPGVLDCNRWRTFWIRWSAKHLEVRRLERDDTYSITSSDLPTKLANCRDKSDSNRYNIQNATRKNRSHSNPRSLHRIRLIEICFNIKIKILV